MSISVKHVVTKKWAYPILSKPKLSLLSWCHPDNARPKHTQVLVLVGLASQVGNLLLASFAPNVMCAATSIATSPCVCSVPQCWARAPRLFHVYHLWTRLSNFYHLATNAFLQLSARNETTCLFYHTAEHEKIVLPMFVTLDKASCICITLPLTHSWQ